MLERTRKFTKAIAPITAFGYIADNALLGVSRHAILTGDTVLLDNVRNYATNYSPLFHAYTTIPEILNNVEKLFNFPVNHDLNITAAFLIPALALPILGAMTAWSWGLMSHEDEASQIAQTNI